MDRDEKRRRLSEWKAQDRALACSRYPLPDTQLRELFDHLDDQMPVRGCDHTLRFTQRWLKGRGIPEDAVLQWLEENGGFCDCEVAMNVRSHRESTRGRDEPGSGHAE